MRNSERRLFRLWKRKENVVSRNTKASIVCPMCGGDVRECGTKWSETVFVCGGCGCRFGLDVGGFLDDDEPINFSPGLDIIDRGRADDFNRVALWLKARHPEFAQYLDNREFYRFLRDFYAYNHWLNRGNEPSFEEMAEEGAFEDDVRCVLGKSDSLDIWFEIQFDETPDDEKEGIDELFRRFQRLRAEYA